MESVKLLRIVSDIDGEAVGRQDDDRFFSLSLQILLIAELDGRIRRCNPAWQEQLGWSPDELIGRSFLDLVHPDDLPATKTVTAKLSASGVTAQFVNDALTGLANRALMLRKLGPASRCMMPEH